MNCQCALHFLIWEVITLNKYFENISTLNELRKQYKELLKIHHPDNGETLEIMQEINSEHDRMFKILKDQHENNNTDQASTRVCLKIAFCHLCVTVCGIFVPNEEQISRKVGRANGRNEF